MRCRTCGRSLPYKSRRHYCCREHYLHRPIVPKVWRAHDTATLLRALNSGRPLEYVAAELGVSRAHLYQCMHQARIVRVGRRGQYAVVHWRNTRQLALF